MRGVGTVKQVVSRYRHFDLEYAALRVVGRGLFLAVMLMVAYLFVFTRVTDLIVGTNEVLIPTTVVNPDIDLGALAQGSFSRTSASVVSVIGVVTLIVSALFTAHALRQGSHRALMGDSATPVRLLSVRTIGLAVVLAIAIFATWLLTLTTSIRHRAWVSLLGWDVGTLAVDVGKGVAVFASLLIVWAGVLTVVRFTFDRVTRRAVVAAVIVAVVVVVANFFLLYTYVGALINPAVSAGIVLVFALLLWVNICVRTYLGALCWVGAPPR